MKRIHGVIISLANTIRFFLCTVSTIWCSSSHCWPWWEGAELVSLTLIKNKLIHVISYYFTALCILQPLLHGQVMAVWTPFLHPSIRIAWKRGFIILFKNKNIHCWVLFSLRYFILPLITRPVKQFKLQVATVEIYVILLDELHSNTFLMRYM